MLAPVCSSAPAAVYLRPTYLPDDGELYLGRLASQLSTRWLVAVRCNEPCTRRADMRLQGAKVRWRTRTRAPARANYCVPALAARLCAHMYRAPPCV